MTTEERMQLHIEALALLREILSIDTRIWDETRWMNYCLFCSQETQAEHDFPWPPQVNLDSPDNHEPTCPIRRAMELLKEVPSNG